jgi:hypothetical protein
VVVTSIEETAVRYSISKQFIALILLPIMVSIVTATYLSNLKRQMRPNTSLQCGWQGKGRWRFLIPCFSTVPYTHSVP